MLASIHAQNSLSHPFYQCRAFPIEPTSKSSAWLGQAQRLEGRRWSIREPFVPQREAYGDASAARIDRRIIRLDAKNGQLEYQSGPRSLNLSMELAPGVRGIRDNWQGRQGLARCRVLRASGPKVISSISGCRKSARLQLFTQLFIHHLPKSFTVCEQGHVYHPFGVVSMCTSI